MFCHDCGEKIADGVKFCPYCGQSQKLSESKHKTDTSPSDDVNKESMNTKQDATISDYAPKAKEVIQQVADTVVSSAKSIGEKINDMPILSVDELENFCQKYSPVVAVLCVPESAARENVKMLVENGVTNFWNFSHFDIAAEFPGTISENVHLNDSLRTLNYQIMHRPEDDGQKE